MSAEGTETECPTCLTSIPKQSYLVHSLHCSNRVFFRTPPSTTPTPSSPTPAPPLVRECLFCALPLPLGALVDHESVCGARTDVCETCGVRMTLRSLARHTETGCVASLHGNTVVVEEDEGYGSGLYAPESMLALDDVLEALDAAGLDGSALQPRVQEVLFGRESMELPVDEIKGLVEDLGRERADVDLGVLGVQLAIWVRYASDAAMARDARRVLGLVLRALPQASEVSHLNAPGLVQFPSVLYRAVLDVIFPLLLDRTLELVRAPSWVRQRSLRLVSDLEKEEEDGEGEGRERPTRTTAARVASSFPKSSAWVRQGFASGPLAHHVQTLYPDEEREGEVAAAVADLDLITHFLVPLLGPIHPPGSLLDLDTLVTCLVSLGSFPHPQLVKSGASLLAQVLGTFPPYGAGFMEAWYGPASVCEDAGDPVGSSVGVRIGHAQTMFGCVLVARLVWVNPYLLLERHLLLGVVSRAERMVVVSQGSAWEDCSVWVLSELMRGVPAFMYAKDVPYLQGCQDLADALVLDQECVMRVVGRRILTATGAGGDQGPMYGSFHTTLSTLYVLDRVVGHDLEPDEVRAAYAELSLWAAGSLVPGLNDAPPVWMGTARPLVRRVVSALSNSPQFEELGDDAREFVMAAIV